MAATGHGRRLPKLQDLPSLEGNGGDSQHYPKTKSRKKTRRSLNNDDEQTGPHIDNSTGKGGSVTTAAKRTKKKKMARTAEGSNPSLHSGLSATGSGHGEVVQVNIIISAI